MAAKKVTIVLEDGKLPDPMDALANKNGPAGGPPDQVRWSNKSTRGRTIVFDFAWWPFVEAPRTIEVQPNRKTEWFDLSPETPSSGYDYKVLPSLVPGTPPDDPKISVGD